jgi:two-component system sensor histidine kinase MtrB
VTERAATDAGPPADPRPPVAAAGPGLRFRLVLAFVLVALVTGAAALVLGITAFSRYRDEVNSRAYTIPQDYAIGELVELLALTVLALLVLVVGVALLAASTVLRPVRRLVSATERMAQGDLSVRLPVHGGDEIARLTAGFNRMATALGEGVDDLRRAEARSRRFAADVAHELRTPLAAMTAVADVLEDETPALRGAAGDAAGLMVRETHHLARLVEDLTEMARFDASTAELRLRDVDVVGAVRHCLEMRGWVARVAVDAPAQLEWPLDPARFELVVANLVGNALRHGAPPVTVTVAATPPGGPGPARLSVTVADRGPGLAGDVLPHVFDRFFKADRSRERTTGSGLGLSLALENARLHGGRITAGNRPDGGAAFTVELPRP